MELASVIQAEKLGRARKVEERMAKARKAKAKKREGAKVIAALENTLCQEEKTQPKPRLICKGSSSSGKFSV